MVEVVGGRGCPAVQVNFAISTPPPYGISKFVIIFEWWVVPPSGRLRNQTMETQQKLLKVGKKKQQQIHTHSESVTQKNNKTILKSLCAGWIFLLFSSQNAPASVSFFVLFFHTLVRLTEKQTTHPPPSPACLCDGGTHIRRQQRFRLQTTVLREGLNRRRRGNSGEKESEMETVWTDSRWAIIDFLHNLNLKSCGCCSRCCVRHTYSHLTTPSY